MPSLVGSEMCIRDRTVGRLRILADGRDVTQRLNEQPRLEFLLSFLLARVARGDQPAIDRTSLADEIAPGLPTGSQRARLRKQLYAIQAALGTELKPLLRTTNAQVGQP